MTIVTTIALFLAGLCIAHTKDLRKKNKGLNIVLKKTHKLLDKAQDSRLELIDKWSDAVNQSHRWKTQAMTLSQELNHILCKEAEK